MNKQIIILSLDGLEFIYDTKKKNNINDHSNIK